jgi:hypothetical protein
MLEAMSKDSVHPRTGAEAIRLAALRAVESLKNLDVVVRLAIVVLISIVITHAHAEPV